MNTEMDFNDEPKHGQVICASGWCGSPEGINVIKPVTGKEAPVKVNEPNIEES